MGFLFGVRCEIGGGGAFGGGFVVSGGHCEALVKAVGWLVDRDGFFGVERVGDWDGLLLRWNMGMA